MNHCTVYLANRKESQLFLQVNYSISKLKNEMSPNRLKEMTRKFMSQNLFTQVKFQVLWNYTEMCYCCGNKIVKKDKNALLFMGK